MTSMENDARLAFATSSVTRPVKELRLFDWDAPLPGCVRQIAEGIWWARVPLDSQLGHVNVYLLEEEDGFTLIDTGTNCETCRTSWRELLESNWFAQRKIQRVIVTHYHPDHIGLAGWFSQQGATIWTTRTCWLYTKTILSENLQTPSEEQIRFVRAAGLNGVELEAYCRRPPNRFARDVHGLPHAYVRIRDRQSLTIGSRVWKVLIGNGHAAEQVTLWSDDGYVITADQILPAMASNLSVYTGEPDEDVVTEWLESCHRILSVTDQEQVCLPGHGPMFQGLAFRCAQLMSSVQSAMERLLTRLQRPASARDCLAAVYGRELAPHEKNALLAETMGFLTHLRVNGLVRMERLSNGTLLWSRISTPAAKDTETSWIRRFDPVSSLPLTPFSSQSERLLNQRKDDHVTT